MHAAEHVHIHVRAHYVATVCTTVCACLQYMYLYACAGYGIHCCRTVTCIHNILSLVCVSDLRTHYVHVMASCGIAWLLCFNVVF